MNMQAKIPAAPLKHTQKVFSLYAGNTESDVLVEIEYTFDPGEHGDWFNPEIQPSIEIQSISSGGIEFVQFLEPKAIAELQEEILCDLKEEDQDSRLEAQINNYNDKVTGLFEHTHSV